ncbi:MAG TPA: hypothetical protein VL551_07870 [Actinospica sp.]|jgi:hypothetical protein|nr:hypothetical protein [Actinospica sp.]
MSEQWRQPPQQGGYSQQPYQQGQPPAAGQPAPPTQPPGYFGQPQLPSDPHPQQPYAPATAPDASSKRVAIISSVVAVAVIGGGLGIYLATQHGGPGTTVQAASTVRTSPGASAQPTATVAASATSAGEDTADLLTTNAVCPAFLAIEQPLISAMNTITDEATGAAVFETYQPKFDALAASTPAGQYKTEIQAVARDLNAIVAYIKANPHMSKPAPAAFDAELNTFQTDADTVDNNCDPLGTSTS